MCECQSGAIPEGLHLIMCKLCKKQIHPQLPIEWGMCESCLKVKWLEYLKDRK